jgi:hypothetical protein
VEGEKAKKKEKMEITHTLIDEKCDYVLSSFGDCLSLCTLPDNTLSHAPGARDKSALLNSATKLIRGVNDLSDLAGILARDALLANLDDQARNQPLQSGASEAEEKLKKVAVELQAAIQNLDTIKMKYQK